MGEGFASNEVCRWKGVRCEGGYERALSEKAANLADCKDKVRREGLAGEDVRLACELARFAARGVLCESCQS